MADSKILEQMLEHLVNNDQAKAEELFHEYVVSKSREIYEDLIESEMADEDVDEAMDSDDEDEVKEASDDLDEEFEDIAVESDDEMGGMGDATDDAEGDFGMGPEMGAEQEEKSEEELFQDLDSIVDELQAKFDQLKGMEAGEHEMDGDTGEEEMEGFGEPSLATVREYVEKVPAGHGAEKKSGAEGQLSGTGAHSDKPSVNAKSIVAGKNDMGGTAANILGGKEDTGAGYVGSTGGQLKGSGLAGGKPQDLNSGNINVPGGKAGSAFNKKEPGHGAEKKGGGEGKAVGAGTGENSVSGKTDTQSLFRGRR